MSVPQIMEVSLPVFQSSGVSPTWLPIPATSGPKWGILSLMHQSDSEFGGRPVSHLVEFLQDIPLFSSLDPDTVGYVIERLRSFEVSTGTRLIQQGEVGDALYVVSSGRLEARDDARDIVLGEITAGEIVGEMALLTEEPRGATVRAVSNVRGYALQKADFLELLRRHPHELKRVAELVTRRAAGLEREQYRPTHHEIVDFLRTVELFSSLSDNALGELAPHLQWFTLPRGEVLLRQGDTGDQLYVVVSGRLQFDISDREGAVVRTGMIHRKDVVGELSILTEEARSATVTAVRDSGLLTLTARTVNRLMNRYPQVILGITRILALRLQAQSRTHPHAGSETIAIVPIHSSISAREFIERFASAIAATATVRVVTRRDAPTVPGAPEITDGRGDVRFRGWLSAIEDEADIVILVGSADDEHWSDLCVRHADRGVLLLDPQADPEPTRFELRYLGYRDGATTLPRELVFCRHGAPYLEHGRIGQFLLRRTHTRHHHVRDMSVADIERVARFATGRAVGIALGGGGARGLAHIGAVWALREAGIPIDLVVGTSIGSLVGAVVAMELTVDEMKAAAEEYLVTDKPFQDPAFPLVSLLRGRKMSAGLQRFFGDLRVEELPLRFAAVATDLVARDVAVLHD
ncbi:MAG TPA: cyclic nucleotide-binding and patatin-like phospholipase domain-containing protein, partial [Alkalispirochaeta sp.]|nr:cyclic nucleotide-binding and patatin-like phospholipase domain-containing protein [Alkalispirochaeta sp.]